jgi:hypothetical protein
VTGGPPVGDRVQQVAGVGYTADELYEHSPCGLLTLSTSGTVLAVNATVLGWTGRQRREVVGRPVVQLLAPSSRLTWETRVAPELGLLGRVTAAELAVRGSGGPDVAVLVSCTITSVTPGAPDVVRVVAFPAGERFAYEHELVRLRRAAEKSAARMRVLHRVASDLTAARTPDDAAERLVRALAEESGASAVTVWLHAPRERVLRRAAGTRAPDELAPELVRLPSASLVATAARTRAVAAVESPSTAPARTRRRAPRSGTRGCRPSWLCPCSRTGSCWAPTPSRSPAPDPSATTSWRRTRSSPATPRRCCTSRSCTPSSGTSRCTTR